MVGGARPFRSGAWSPAPRCPAGRGRTRGPAIRSAGPRRPGRAAPGADRRARPTAARRAPGSRGPCSRPERPSAPHHRAATSLRSAHAHSGGPVDPVSIFFIVLGAIVVIALLWLSLIHISEPT